MKPPADGSGARPIAFSSVTGPAAPDLEQARADGLKRHEEELALAERLAAAARAGSAPASTAEHAPGGEARTLEPGDYFVEFDWRGETATYYEHDRLLTLSCSYWGGPKGSVAHRFAAWEYRSGHRELLSVRERGEILARVIDRALRVHGITLEATGE